MNMTIFILIARSVAASLPHLTKAKYLLPLSDGVLKMALQNITLFADLPLDIVFPIHDQRSRSHGLVVPHSDGGKLNAIKQ